MKSISWFLPAYNEEKNLPVVVPELNKILKELTSDYEIIIVNDGSADNTKKVADSLAKRLAKVRVINHVRNQGYGGAIQSGLRGTKKDLVGFVGADQQFDLNEIEKFVKYSEKYPIVLGYRAKRNDPANRRFNAFVWNILVRFLTGLKIKDVDCGFKLFERKILKNVKMKSKGALIDTEILAQLQRQNIPIKEIPVKHFPRKEGKQTGANIGVIIKALKEILKLSRELKNQ